nr:MATE family efflux transporter [Chitinophagaceae bacterium]
MSDSSSIQIKNTYANIIKLALPIGISILIPQLNLFTNTLFLGYYKPKMAGLSTQDLLSASGIAGIYYLTLVMICYGLVSGMLMFMSRSAGENEKSGIGKTFNTGLALCLFLAFALILLSNSLAPWLFNQAIHAENIRQAALSFIRIRYWGLPFVILYQMSNTLFLATSQSKNIIYGSLAQTLINIFLDYVLIFGMFSFPEMGLNGTALASVISEFVFFAVGFSIIRFGKSYLTYQIQFFKKPDFGFMKQILMKSSPLIFQNFLSIGAWEAFFIFVEHLGKAESALSQILRSVFGIVGIAAWALASTCNSMVSNIIGQGKLDEVIPLIKKIISISFLVAFSLGFFIFLFPESFLNVLTNDQELVQKGVVSLRIVVLATWMLSVSTICFNGVIGTGN